MTDQNSPSLHPFDLPEQRFFGRRKGQALSQKKQALLDRLYPQLALSPKQGKGPWVARDIVAEATGLWMEIGFGKGEHLAWQAAQNPSIAMIGCEPYINGVAALLGTIEDEKLGNVRLYADDARHILDRLSNGALERLFLIHPDPWPKSRHARRRFVNPIMLDVIARVLAPGAEFRIATDHPIYREWTLIQMAHRNDFVWTAETPQDWCRRPKDWPETRYAKKALEGDAVFLIYRRR